MKHLKKLIAATIATLMIPVMAFAVTGVGWSATNLTDKYISPNLLNGTSQAIKVPSTATSSVANLQNAFFVPDDFATNGCAGDSSKTKLDTCVEALLALAATKGLTSATIWIMNDVPQSQWTATMDIAQNGIPTSLFCRPGVRLKYGGSGNAIKWDNGNPTGHLKQEVSGCLFMGQNTLIAAAQSNSTTTVGLYLGGSNGAVGINVHDNIFNGFGTQVEIGANAYMLGFYENGFSGGNGTTTARGSLIHVNVASNSGERNVFIGNNFTDPGNSIADNAIYITSGGTASNYFGNNSIDNAQVYCGASNGTCTFVGNHFENPGSPNSYTEYIPILNPSSDGSTQITLIGNVFANSASNKTWTTIVKHGGQFYAAGNNIQNYNGSTVTNFVDHSNNNGQASDMVCQLQVQGGALTNIVAGSGGLTWSLTNGVPCSYNRSNSYTIGLRPLATNVNEFFSGNSVTGTYDHDGNWFFGNTSGTTGTVTLNNLTINGTCTGCGSGSAYPFTSSTWNTYNVQATTSQLSTTGMYVSSSSDPIADLGGNALPGSWPMMLWNPISATGSSTGLAFGVSSTVGGSPGAGIGFIRQGANSYGDLFFATADNGSAMTEKMRIKGNGSVGIGTSTPVSNILVTLASSTNPQLSLSAGSGVAQWVLRNAGGNLYIATTTVAGTATTSISAITIDGTTGSILLQSKTATNPSISFVGNTNYGLYFNSSSGVAISHNGTDIAGTRTNAFAVGSGIPLIWTSSGLTGTIDTGLSRLSAGKIGVGNGTASDVSGTLIANSIGIGSSTPFKQFSLQGADTGTTQSVLWTNSANSTILIARNDQRVGIGGNPGSTLSSAGNLSVGSTYVGLGGGTNALIVEGNVGIGSSSPMSNLVVNGVSPRILFVDTSQTQPAGFYTISNNADKFQFYRGILGASGSEMLQIDNGTTTVAQLELKNKTGGVFAGNSPISFRTDRISYINNNFSFGFGTTTANTQYQVTISSSTAPQLALSDGGGDPHWVLRNAGGSFYLATSSVAGTATSTTASLSINTSGVVSLGNYANCTGTNALQVSSSQVVCGSTVSDIRLKKDVTPLNGGLETILKLKPVSYYWKDLTNHNTLDPREQYGFIAQDVEKIIPSAIGKSDDGYKTLDKTAIIPYLVDAVQKLSANNIPAQTKKSAEDNWQWIAMALMLGWIIRLEIKTRK